MHTRLHRPPACAAIRTVAGNTKVHCSVPERQLRRHMQHNGRLQRRTSGALHAARLGGCQGRLHACAMPRAACCCWRRRQPLASNVCRRCTQLHVQHVLQRNGRIHWKRHGSLRAHFCGSAAVGKDGQPLREVGARAMPGHTTIQPGQAGGVGKGLQWDVGWQQVLCTLQRPVRGEPVGVYTCVPHCTMLYVEERCCILHTCGMLAAAGTGTAAAAPAAHLLPPNTCAVCSSAPPHTALRIGMRVFSLTTVATPSATCLDLRRTGEAALFLHYFYTSP